MTYTGDPAQVGTFTGGLSAGGVDQAGNSGIGFDNGIIMSSGTATDNANPQTTDENSTGFGGAGDADLTAQTGNSTYDAAVLEFDFNPGDATQVYFNFVFGTDEYPDSPSYNDGFGIFVNGTNVALIPGDHTPVQISDFLQPADQQYYKEDSSVAALKGNPDNFPTQDINVEIQSMSVPIQAIATVTPNAVNHIKFAIADSGDDVVDSFVFVQGGSLSTTPVSVTPTPNAPTLSLDPASDSGVTGDSLTDVPTPVIDGTGTTGDTITLYDGATQIGTATVDANGLWSITSTALTDGVHNLTATQSTGGNTSDPSATLTLTVDTSHPTVTGVTASPSSGAVDAGNEVAINVATSEAVTVVDGTPTLTLNSGGTATYDAAASTPDNMVFDYTVAAGENAADLMVNAVNLNGAVITDSAGNAADLSAVVGAELGSPTGPSVDTVAPTVTGLEISTDSGTLTTGDSVTITLVTSEGVAVTNGVPSLLLSSGGTATYDAAASTSTNLVFDYTVSAGDNAADVSIRALNLNGATITDAAGNNADLASALGVPLGSADVDTGMNPFADLQVSNANAAAVVTVTAAVSPSMAGVWSNLGSGTIGSDGVTYTVTGTAAQVSAALAGVTLSPTSGMASDISLSVTLADADPTQPSLLTDMGSGASVLTATTQGEMLQGGSGSETLIGTATGVVIHAGSGPTTVLSAAGGNTLIGLGNGPATVNAQGADTIVGGSGTAVISAAADSLIGLSGSATVSAGQGSVIIGGGGTELVAANGSGVLLFSGSGNTTFIGGTGSSTVIGGSGQSTIFGGSGGGLFAGGTGGSNVIVGGTQASTVFGAGNGDILYAAGSGGTMMAAGAGNETLVGANSSGNDVYFGGSGNDLIGLGSGNDVVFAGTGSSTVVAGQGADIFAFTNGQAGGSETIYGFKLGTDQLSLQGYASGEFQRDLASAVTTTDPSSGVASTTLTLSDHTQITLAGLNSASARMI